MEAGEINSLLEHWKFLELLELPENIDAKNINFKACSSLKKIILNGDYDSEKLNCPLMPKWIQVIYGLIIFKLPYARHYKPRIVYSLPNFHCGL